MKYINTTCQCKHLDLTQLTVDTDTHRQTDRDRALLCYHDTAVRMTSAVF